MPNPFAGVNLSRLLNLRVGGTQRLVNRATGTQGRAMAGKMVRKMAFDVGARLTKSLNGIYEAPKRIDTGRYRASWAVGTEEAVGIRVAGAGGRDSRGRFLSASAGSPASSPASQPGDGRGFLSLVGLTAVATVTSNVEYGPYIEFGTRWMAAGYHRSHALDYVQRTTSRALGILIQSHLEGR